MRETDIEIQQTSKNPFEKRTVDQRKADRQFITECIAHNPQASKTEIFSALIERIKERGDEYTLDYTYVCTEITKIRKDLQGVGIIDEAFVQNEIMRSLDLINEQIAICCDQIRIRLTEREDVREETETVNITDFKGMSLEEISIFNRFKNRMTRERTVKRKIRGGQDVRDMMEMLHKYIQSKRELLGEDQPKKISQKIDATITDKQTMTLELFEREVSSLGYDPTLMRLAFEQTIKKNGKRASNEG